MNWRKSTAQTLKIMRQMLSTLSYLAFCNNLPLEPDCTACYSSCNKKPGKCGENEGDCDYDSHCKAGLKCGSDNCPSGFPSYYDCCYKVSGIYCSSLLNTYL